MKLLVMATRDRKNPSFAGGDLTLTEVSERFAQRGDSVTYVCSSFKGANRKERVRGVKIVRLGNLWTASVLALFFYLRNRQNFEAVLEEVLGGLRVPYFAPLYVRKPLVGVWYQRNEKIFRFQYNRIASEMLNLLEYALAIAHRSRLILCPSRRSTRDLSELGLTPNYMRLYTPGIDEKILRRTSEAPSSHRENLIVWIGKMRKYKCTHHAILTLERLRKLVPSTRLLIAGFPEDPKYLEYLGDLSNRLGLNESITFRFRISEEEKGQILLRAKALLVTSPIEGFANVVSEANACGTPAVVTEGVPPDVVRNGTNGFRANFGDFDALANHCRSILSDKSTFERLSRASVDCARGRSWTRTAEVFLGAIEEASWNKQNGVL